MGPRDLYEPLYYFHLDGSEPSLEFTTGECLKILRQRAENMYDCCVTSPPYYFTRDYGEAEQLGLEYSPVEYVENLTAVFREVRRVLKPSGTLWLNLGDNYCTRRAIRADGKRTVAKGGDMKSWAQSARDGHTITGAQFRELHIKEKDLFLCPHEVALALRTDGWYLRGVFHWIKTAVVPEKQRDGPSDAVEYIFLFSKEPTGYVYHADVLRELGVDGLDGEGRPHRNVWELGPSSFRSSHTATMPEEMAARCIMTGSNPGGLILDPFGGTGTTAVVAAEFRRNCHCIEVNPDFTAVALARIRAVKATYKIVETSQIPVDPSDCST